MGWIVLDIEHKLSNGWVKSVTAAYEKQDGPAYDRKVVYLFLGDDGTPTYVFEDLTEADVLQWVFDDLGATRKAEIQLEVDTRAAEFKVEIEQPEYGHQKPWE
jgi:hypothetical protein